MSESAVLEVATLNVQMLMADGFAGIDPPV